MVSDTFLKWLLGVEERKWGWRRGAGAMGDELVGRKDRQRPWQWVPRLNHHPWRRHIAEVKPLGRGLEEGGTGAGDDSVEAAGLGRGSKRGQATAGGWG